MKMAVDSLRMLATLSSQSAEDMLVLANLFKQVSIYGGPGSSSLVGAACWTFQKWFFSLNHSQNTTDRFALSKQKRQKLLPDRCAMLFLQKQPNLEWCQREDNHHG